MFWLGLENSSGYQKIPLIWVYRADLLQQQKCHKFICTAKIEYNVNHLYQDALINKILSVLQKNSLLTSFLNTIRIISELTHCCLLKQIFHTHQKDFFNNYRHVQKPHDEHVCFCFNILVCMLPLWLSHLISPGLYSPAGGFFYFPG